MQGRERERRGREKAREKRATNEKDIQRPRGKIPFRKVCQDVSPPTTRLVAKRQRRRRWRRLSRTSQRCSRQSWKIASKIALFSRSTASLFRRGTNRSNIPPAIARVTTTTIIHVFGSRPGWDRAFCATRCCSYLLRNAKSSRKIGTRKSIRAGVRRKHQYVNTYVSLDIFIV